MNYFFFYKKYQKSCLISFTVVDDKLWQFCNVHTMLLKIRQGVLICSNRSDNLIILSLD